MAVLRLAGFALAHAAWSVEDGETLRTLAMVETNGERELVRYEADSIPDSVELAHSDLRQKLAEGGCAALVVDGYATPSDGSPTDALIIEMLGAAGQPLGTLVQPYRAARRSRIPFIGRASGFAIIGEPIPSDDTQVPEAARIVLESAREHPRAGHLFKP